jgi:hypothetical protein
MGFQPWNIRIHSEDEIAVFCTTVALCFNIGIQLTSQSKDGIITKVLYNPCGVQECIYISSRPTMSTATYLEIWIPHTKLNEYLTSGEKV